MLRPGKDVTLIGTGGTVWNALEAARRLDEIGGYEVFGHRDGARRLCAEMGLRSQGKFGMGLADELAALVDPPGAGVIVAAGFLMAALFASGGGADRVVHCALAVLVPLP